MFLAVIVNFIFKAQIPHFYLLMKILPELDRKYKENKAERKAWSEVTVTWV